jgi:hypothetical protein
LPDPVLDENNRAGKGSAPAGNMKNSRVKAACEQAVSMPSNASPMHHCRPAMPLPDVDIADIRRPKKHKQLASKASNSRQKT